MLWKHTAVELTARVRSGELHPDEIRSVLSHRIQRLDDEVGAVTGILTGTRRGASVADPLHAPLAGLPLAVKEIIDVAGFPITRGSAVFADRVALEDATVIRRLRDAGAMVLAAARSHEFAWGITTQGTDGLGSTSNPWRLDRVPGGSSGGSAAAVAMGFVPVALGTDTGGSVRIPANFCGVVGFKPTYGTVPLDGVCPLAPSLDHVGLFARDVSDAGLVFEAIIDKAAVLPVAPAAGPLRAGIWVNASAPLDEDRRLAMDRMVFACDELGWMVEQVEIGEASALLPVYATLMMREAWHVHTRVLGTFPEHRDRYSRALARRLDRAGRVSDHEIRAASRERARLASATRRLLSRVDLLISPVSATGPSAVADPDHVTTASGRAAFRDVVLPHTVLHNLVGLPSLTLPVRLDADGVPVGIQIAGARRKDRQVLAAGLKLEALLAWRGWPPLANRSVGCA